MATAQNSFTDGMAIDNSPLVQPNTTLSNCLNGTILTFNGNEYVLQNEIGNGKIGQNAQNVVRLKDGFIPIGMKEHNGVLYIVSIKDTGTLDASGNPIYQEEIGSFPAPGDESGELIHRDDQAFQRAIDNRLDSGYIALFPGSQLHQGDRIDINILGYSNINNIDFSDLNNTGTNGYQNKLGQLNLRLTKSGGATQDVTNIISGSNVIINSPVLTLSDCKNPSSISIADLGDSYSIQYDTFLDTINFRIYSTHITIENNYDVYMSMNPLIKITYNCPDGKFNSNLTIDNSSVSNPGSYVNSQYNYIEGQREVNALYMMRYTDRAIGEIVDDSEYIGDPVYLVNPTKYNYDSSTKLFTKEFEYSIYPGATYAHLFGIKKVGTQQALFRTSSDTVELNSCSIDNKSIQNCFYWDSTGSDIVIHNQVASGGGGFNWVFFDIENSNEYGILKNPQASSDTTLQGYVDYQIQSTGLNPQLNNSHFYIALKVQFGEGVDMSSITNGEYDAYFTDLQYYIPGGVESFTYVSPRDDRDSADNSPWDNVTIPKTGTSNTFFIPNSRWFTYTAKRELNPKLGEYNTNSPIFGGALVSTEYSPQIAFGHSSGNTAYYDSIKVVVSSSPSITNYAWYNHPEYLFESNFNSESPLKAWLNFGNPYVSAWTSSGSATGSDWVNYRLESIEDYLQLFTSIYGDTVSDPYRGLFTINAPANPSESQPQINFSYELNGADSLVEITARNESYVEDKFMVASVPLTISPTKLKIQTNYFVRQVPYVQNLTISYSNNKFYIRSAATDDHTMIPSTNIEITEISENIWSQYQSDDFGLLGNFLLNKYKDWAANGVFIKITLENVKSYYTPKEGLSDQIFIGWFTGTILLEYFPSNSKQTDLMEEQIPLERFWPDFNYPSPTYEEVTIYDYNLTALQQFITGTNSFKLKLKVPEDYVEYKGQPLYGENGLIPTRLQQWKLNEVLIADYYSKTEQKYMEESVDLEYIIRDTLVKTKESEIPLTTEKEKLESVLLENTNIDSISPSFFSNVRVFRVQLEDGSYSYGAVTEDNFNQWDYKFIQYQKYTSSHKLDIITSSLGFKDEEGNWNTTYNVGFNESSENDISYDQVLELSQYGLYYSSSDGSAILSFIPKYTRLTNYGELEIS